VEDSIGEAFGFGPVVGDVQNGDARAIPDLGQNGNDFAPCLIIEGRQGLIEAEDRRMEGQGPTQGDTLAFSAAHAGRQPIQERGQAQPFSQFPVTGFAPLRSPATHFQGKLQVLTDGQVIKESAILRNESNASLSGRQLRDLTVSDPNRSRPNRAQTANSFEQGGFT
jgi:hypothetical protein